MIRVDTSSLFEILLGSRLLREELFAVPQFDLVEAVSITAHRWREITTIRDTKYLVDLAAFLYKDTGGSLRHKSESEIDFVSLRDSRQSIGTVLGKSLFIGYRDAVWVVKQR